MLRIASDNARAATRCFEMAHSIQPANHPHPPLSQAVSWQRDVDLTFTWPIQQTLLLVIVKGQLLSQLDSLTMRKPCTACMLGEC